MRLLQSISPVCTVLSIDGYERHGREDLAHTMWFQNSSEHIHWITNSVWKDTLSTQMYRFVRYQAKKLFENRFIPWEL